MTILLTAIGEAPQDWRTAFRAVMPMAEIRIWPEIGNREDIEVAVIGTLPHGELAKLPHLRLIASIFAGQDLLLADETLPASVPIVRTDNPAGDAMMSEFVLLHVLRHHRNLPAYASAQHDRIWRRLPQPRADDRRVGIMGLGPIGLGAARAVGRLGFQIAAWTRRPRQVEGVTVFYGPKQFASFLARSEIVVNLLPLTPLTGDILDARAFAAMPKGSALINLGRGEHVVDDDLLEAIASCQIAAATLDVFRTEPLPADSPYWTNPAVTVTPHAARRLDAIGIAQRVANSIRCLDEGRPLTNLVDRLAGY